MSGRRASDLSRSHPLSSIGNNDGKRESAGDAAEGNGADPFFGNPGHLLRCAHQSAVGIFLSECDSLDLTPPQYAALVALGANGPLEQVALGGVAALDRTTVAVVLKSLQARELVDVNPSPTDKRAKRAELTDSGRKVLKAADEASEKAQNKVLLTLTPREQKQFMKLLLKLVEGNNRYSRAPFKEPKQRD